FEALGVPIRALGLSRTTSFRGGRAALAGVMREAAPDVIHTQGLRADWLAARLAGAPAPRTGTSRRCRPSARSPSIMGQRAASWRRYR
ncbi:MAG: hypothetical protein WD230_09750, partial [Cucumibacter sp.]